MNPRLMLAIVLSIRSLFDDLMPLLGQVLGDLMIESALADMTAKNTGTEINQ